MKKICLLLLLSAGILFSCKETKNEEKEIKKEKTEVRKVEDVFKAEHRTDGYTFFIEADNKEMTEIKLYSKGLPTEFNETVEVEGQVLESFMLDLNGDGFKEFYLSILLTDDSGNKQIMGFASNKGKSISMITVEDTDRIRDMRTDKIFAEDGQLKRSFTDKGEEVIYTYRLEAGETGYILKAESSSANGYAPQSSDDARAKEIKTFLKDDYLKKDLPAMQQSDRKFQYYATDMNEDGKEEIFVRLLSPYFCGTGGCTFLLLTHDFKVINRFTVTRAPIFIEKTKANGWPILLVKDSGVFKELVFENGSYPSNPSVLPKAPYDAPSGHAQILFDEDFSKPKTYTF